MYVKKTYLLLNGISSSFPKYKSFLIMNKSYIYPTIMEIPKTNEITFLCSSGCLNEIQFIVINVLRIK